MSLEVKIFCFLSPCLFDPKLLHLLIIHIAVEEDLYSGFFFLHVLRFIKSIFMSTFSTTFVVLGFRHKRTPNSNVQLKTSRKKMQTPQSLH